jgi:hypothetical protein
MRGPLHHLHHKPSIRRGPSREPMLTQTERFTATCGPATGPSPSLTLRARHALPSSPFALNPSASTRRGRSQGGTVTRSRATASCAPTTVPSPRSIRRAQHSPRPLPSTRRARLPDPTMT